VHPQVDDPILLDCRVGVSNCYMGSETLHELVLPSGIVGAFKKVVFGLRLVAPGAFVVGGAFHSVLPLSGRQ
jgi:hypothetical protein